MARRIRTIPDLLRWRVERTPEQTGVFEFVDGRWRPVTWSEYWEQVWRVAFGLEALGLSTGRRIAVVAPTSFKWDVLDKAAMLLGAVVVGIDPVLPEQRILSVIARLGATFVALDPRGPLDVSKLRATPGVERVILLEGSDDEAGEEHGATTWGELRSCEPDDSWEPAGPSADDPAAIISTSGTTGEPKAVEYRHGQIVDACFAIHAALPFVRSDRAICWLPLASLFQRVVNLCGLLGGAGTYFLSDPQMMMEAVRGVRPTAFIGVPRVFEKIHDGAHETIRRLPRAQRSITRWAVGVGRLATSRRGTDGRLPHVLRVALWIADRVALGRLRKALGGELRVAVTGTAPCPDHVLEFFHAIGIPLLEAYGITENVTPMSMNRLGGFRPGSVGKPLEGNEIVLADDGEILVRGPGVFAGYLDPAGSNGRFTNDGFFATGDCGHFDGDGFLHITGRKNEVFKTSSGHKVSLTHLEGVLQSSELIDHAVVCGDGCAPLVALLALDVDVVRQRLRSEIAPMRPDPEVERAVLDEIITSNGRLARFERIPGFLLLADGLSVDRGELTPSWKVRRSAIEAQYGSRIEAFRRRLEARPRDEPIVEWL